MRYLDEFRNKRLGQKLTQAIKKNRSSELYSLMEVCGTHTMNISKFGIRDMLPENIRLLSGPGCPVCVTPASFIDKAVYLSGIKDVIVITFGDMFRVPGSSSSLMKERAKGRTVKIVYSPMDALKTARLNPTKEAVFLGVGFETTAPLIATSIMKAKSEGIKNYSVLCGHKTMPRALRTLVDDRDLKIDGFILPAHVSTIIGSRPYEFLASVYKKRCVIAGFEPLDILQGILMLISQKSPRVEIQYDRVVKKSGNRIAQGVINRVFESCTSTWRGFGPIEDSGLRVSDEYSDFNAEPKFGLKVREVKEDKRCICGSILRGLKTPLDCTLFGKVCKPDKPIGPCMVSSEGTCSAYYKYESKKLRDRVRRRGWHE